MRMWTVIDMARIPFIFQEGLTNPSYEEIIFRADPEFLQEDALQARHDEGPDYLPAFFEVDFPDEELDQWFSVCVDSNYEEIQMEKDALVEEWEGGHISDEEYQEGVEGVAALEEAFSKDDVRTFIDQQRFVCLYTVVPPEMLKLLDPETMLEAALTEDQAAFLEALQTADVKSLESLGPNFWVWLIMFMAGLFGPGWSEKVEQEEAARKAEGRRERRRKPRRKGKAAKKRKPRKRKKKQKMAGVGW